MGSCGGWQPGGMWGVRQRGTLDDASLHRQMVGDGWDRGTRPLHGSSGRVHRPARFLVGHPVEVATPATVNPILLYLGMLLSVGGMALAWRRDRGASTALAAKQRASQAKRSGQIFVGNFAYMTTREELRQLFEAYGAVEHVHLVTERETGRSRGFAFVTMVNAPEARAAIAELQGTTFGGRTLTVTEARQREERHGPRRPRG